MLLVTPLFPTAHYERPFRRAFVLFVTTVALVGCSRKPPEPLTPTPPIVTVTYPIMQQVNDYEDFAGRTEPLKASPS